MIVRSLILVFFALISLKVKGQDFRKVNWGMALEEVKLIETAELLSETSDFLVYQTKLADYDAMVIYIFGDNQLTRSRYMILEEHTNKNDFITDYKTIQGLLREKYELPYKDEIIWRNDLYKEEYSDWGFAISLGHLIYYTYWGTDNTEINLMLSGDNYEIETIIEYTNKELSDFEKQLRNENDLDAFSIFGFRNNSWGDSKSRVKEKENLELLSEDSELMVYDGGIAGMNMYVAYLFTSNKLTVGKYLVTEEHSNKNDYIIDYNNLKEILVKKYGQPFQDKIDWKNDLYKDDFSDWGFAISLGHLVYYVTFENDKSETIMMLSGDNYEIRLMVEVRSKEFQHQSDKDLLDDF